jgi:uncharacterized protein YrrD
MFKLELREGASVFSPGDEQIGKISGFVLDPATNEVTHIVVQKGWLFPEDKVLPFDMVDSATEDKVILKKEIDNFDELPAFEEAHYINADVSRGGGPRYTVPAYYWYPPYGYLGYPVGYYGWPPFETVRNIPEDTIPLEEETDVMSSDGKHVGDVERLFVEPESNKVTHFVISQGIFFKDRKLVPTHWVRSVGEDKVHLAVTSEFLEQLPSYEE